MKVIVSEIISVLLFIWWMLGFVVAKGVLETVMCIFPPYSYYLVLNQLNNLHHFI